METLRIGVLSLSLDDTITQHKTAALTLCGLAPTNITGKRLSDTDLFIRIPELGGQLQATRLNNNTYMLVSTAYSGSGITLARHRTSAVYRVNFPSINFLAALSLGDKKKDKMFSVEKKALKKLKNLNIFPFNES